MGGSQSHDISFEKVSQGGKKNAEEMWLEKASQREMSSREGRETIFWQNCHKPLNLEGYNLENKVDSYKRKEPSEEHSFCLSDQPHCRKTPGQPMKTHQKKSLWVTEFL